MNYKGIIYKVEPIENGDEGDIYIGSTMLTLKERITRHKSSYKRFINKQNKHKITIYNIFNKYGYENCNFKIIENLENETKEDLKIELFKKEAFNIKNIKCVNKYIPLRNNKQYRNDHRERLREHKKIYYNDNKDHFKKYNENNKDKIRMSLQFRLQYIFFTEKNMELEILPPYLHKTEVSQYGHVASGKFNISKWFRAISIEYLLWPNTNMLSCLSSDVAMYLKFYSSIPVILKEFIPNEFIRQCANASASAMKITPKKSLDFRYSQFENSGLTSSIVKNIKGNLI
jgi:Uri superfamily endonuclease